MITNKIGKCGKKTLAGAAAIASLAMNCQVSATEGGGSIYPVGVESWMVGAMPPEGFYSIVYAQHYQADSLKDNNGNSLPVDFDLSANVIAPRFVWVTGEQILGGSLAFHTIIPLIDLDVEIMGQRDDNKSVGDITFGTGLGYHYSDKFHASYGLDIYAPTGDFSTEQQANPGRNHWAAQAVIATSYVDPAGLNIDGKFMYGVNAKNDDTDYKSGQELIIDYAIGWALSPEWVVGVGGYYYQQTTNDELNGVTLTDSKGKSFAIGPAIKYSNSDGWFLTAKWQTESAVRNRAEGEAFWLKLVLPL